MSILEKQFVNDWQRCTLAKDFDLEEIFDLGAIMASAECHLMAEVGELVACEKIYVSRCYSEVMCTAFFRTQRAG